MKACVTYFPRACGSLKVSTYETVLGLPLDSIPALSPHSEDIDINYLPEMSRAWSLCLSDARAHSLTHKRLSSSLPSSHPLLLIFKFRVFFFLILCV